MTQRAKTSAIPSTQGLLPGVKKVLDAHTEILEAMTGRRGQYTPLKALPANATLAETIDKVNEVIERLNT